jgi:hydrogenase nickel incorporation protein HypB
LKIAVLVGDLTTTRDAERMAKHCDLVRQINTGKGCHLNANQIRQGMASLPVETLDLLIVENVGNLICPAGMDVGQDAKIGMFSVTEGDDKPAKHPYIVLESQLLLLNKIDLLPYVPFDSDAFVKDVHSVREDVPIVNVSAHTGEGVEDWFDWLRKLVERVTT